MKPPAEVRAYMKKIGTKGGQAKSDAKRASSQQNIAKALAARMAKKKLTT